MGTAITRREWYQLRVKNIKDAVSMEALLSRVGVDVYDRAMQIQCPMTFNHTHGDRTKSARYYPESQTFKCYVCTDKAVDVIGFAEFYNRIPFAQAVRWLENEFNIQVPKAELVKELDEVVGDILDLADDDFVKLEAQRDYGLRKLQESAGAFTLEQATALYGVIDELWFDIKQGRKDNAKAERVTEAWLNKLREISNRHEDEDVF